VEKYWTAGQATDDSKVHAHLALDTQCYKYTHTHTHTHRQYVILPAFPLQQRLHERTVILRYMYSACVVVISVRLSGSLLELKQYMLPTQLMCVICEMWQYVWTSEGNIQASGVKYIKRCYINHNYHCIYFRSCILYRWPERHPLKSKRVLVVWTANYFFYCKSNTKGQQKFLKIC